MVDAYRAPGGGVGMFARYAYAPNALGYCGPPEPGRLRDGSPAEVRAAAVRFTGAWPYLRVLSRMTGIADPLDARLVESYWLGGGIGATLDRTAFAAELMAVIEPLAGHYWNHLTDDLAEEAAPDHCFHVFGIYPWTRLLRVGTGATAVRVLDSCRITCGLIVAREGPEIVVRSRGLGWDGHRLRLAEPTERRIAVTIDGYSAVPDVRPGEVVSLHWDRLCARLTPRQAADLSASTARQLDWTNRRLSREQAE
ncbi:DUF6390 family protein [Nocardia cyriacigeorgica]|uniref:DUF6390 family protein n=1 Tax=Nocardia cyriacigeorgica TaxID=135487 RepID=UPI002454D64E|nr:DUF6390 family protein [Nocardia cyriacigeorgica]